METPKEKVIQLINKELEENYELINDEKNYYHDDIQAVKIQTNFLAKMLLEIEEIPDNSHQIEKLEADKAELLERKKGYAQILQIVLDNPANNLSKSTIDLIGTLIRDLENTKKYKQ